MAEAIVVRGAREHNLKGFDVSIPRDKLVVITGLSGSGKSSLAFDTLYAEGQRRYVESLSAYARQFLNQNQKPDVESIDGLSPAIAIEQKSASKNPRSTVGTLTEIYDYLRLLYARIGVPHCYNCGDRIAAQTVQQIVDTVLALPEGSRFMVLAPVVRGRKGEYKKEFADFAKAGFARVRVDGAIFELGQDIDLDKNKKHSIDIVVDRLVIKADIKQRLTDAVELALKRAEGLVTIAVVNGDKSDEHTYSERFACQKCGISLPEIAPRLFSFNSPFGACVTCGGLGEALEFDMQRLIPDDTKSLAEGALAPWSRKGAMSGYYARQVEVVAESYRQSVDKAWKKLPQTFRDVVMQGSGEREFEFNFEGENSTFKFKRSFEGVLPFLTRRLREASSPEAREEFVRYMTAHPCQSCHGARLKPEALAIKVEKQTINDVCDLTIAAAHDFFSQIKLSDRDSTIAAPILKEVKSRLNFLLGVGLDYLNLARGAGSLSGGEAQRIRLATQIGSALRGVIYVLDEPSIGLHQRDNERLLTTLKRLRDLGNTVLVVEHDEDTIRAADWILDMGPGAGIHGGNIVAQGSPKQITEHKESLTGAYLRGERSVPLPKERRSGNGKYLEIKGARGNNLKNIDVKIPLGTLVCVTGVSGSGKSTLVNDTLYRAVAKNFLESVEEAAPHKEIRGAQHFDKIIDIDQSPIGRTPRSNPATYTGLFGPIRDIFAGLPESRARGYGPGRYSFNVKGGRCEACEGDGLIRIEMHFLPDVFVTCEQCGGKRYNRETLEVDYKGKSIADVLAMSIDEAVEFLSAIPALKRRLLTLQDVGLGYIKLGQSATTFSGGEAQRIKLSRELGKRGTGQTLYILDEPTTGLHFYDVERLVEVLHTLVGAGNTVIVIEHNLDVIKTADYIVDLGPEGGLRGGTILATGTPEHIAEAKQSYTGHFLRPLLGAPKNPGKRNSVPRTKNFENRT